MTFYIIASVCCVLLSAFFSASEMALSSANRIRLEKLADEGKSSAAIAVRIIERFDDSLSAILIGNNFVNIALSSLGSVIAITAFGEEYTWLATVIVTVTVIIFGETMPKMVAKKNATRLAAVISFPVRLLTIVFKPLTFLVVGLVHLLTCRMRGEARDDSSEAAVEELQSIIETAEDEDVIDGGRSELLQAALDFDEISASEVMTARVDIAAVDIKDSPEEIFAAACDYGYSRIPVYEGSIDNIIGTLYLNQYFKALTTGRPLNLRAMLMKPCFIYKTTKLPNVLEQLRLARQHLAVVTDEYGGVLGIITMEDVLEQIVGEIWDETDEIEDEVVERSDGAYELDGDMAIGDFAELLGLEEQLSDTDSSTVGGWTIEIFGSFPSAGQSIDFENYRITVLEMDGLRVEKVLVTPLEEKAEEE